MTLSRFLPAFGTNDALRFAYLRQSVLRGVLDDDRVLDALVRDLEVPGKPALLKALSRAEKLEAVERQVEHFRTTKTSRWYEVSPLEVLAASIFRSELADRYVFQLFCNVRNEDALFEPVCAWLKAKGLSAFDEVPMGTSRVDVMGYRKGGWLSSAETIAVELKDDLNQMKRGLDQMTTYREYAHKVYLAITPYLAADYVDRHAEAANVRHWDAGVLDRKLAQVGVGLLLVEGDQVYEYRQAQVCQPHEKKLQEVDSAVREREPL